MIADLRSRPLLAVVLAVLAFLVAGSGVLAAVGTHSWPFGSRPAAALVLPTATDFAVGTLTAEPTVTPVPTVVQATWPPSLPANATIDLGCGATPPPPAANVIRSGSATAVARHMVALTFDDGPSPDWTANMLTTLEQTHTPATFFVVGASARSYPNLIQREVADGFAIGIHTWDHPYMTRLTAGQRAWEIYATVRAIHNDLSPQYCLPYWRPPFGDYNGTVVTQMRGFGLNTVTWSVDPRDWSSPGVQTIVDRVLTTAQPGSIILLHDGYFHRQQTAQALPLIIQGLQSRGLVPATLPQLLS
jgi:chitooligosaccharide deacetylase